MSRSKVTVAGFADLGGHDNPHINIMMSTMLISLLSGTGMDVPSFDQVGDLEKKNGFWTNTDFNPLIAVGMAEDLGSTVCVTGSYLASKNSIYFSLYVYDIWSHSLMLQRTYSGMPTKEIFSTVDSVARDIVLMVRGKAPELGTLKVKVLSGNKKYRINLNGNDVSMIDRESPYQNSFLAGQTITVSIRDLSDTWELYKRDLTVNKDHIVVLGYDPSCSVLFRTGRPGIMVLLDGKVAGMTGVNGELLVSNVVPDNTCYYSMIWNGTEYARGTLIPNEEQTNLIEVVRESVMPGWKLAAGLILPVNMGLDIAGTAGTWPGFIAGAGISALFQFLDPGLPPETSLGVRFHFLVSRDTYYPVSEQFVAGSFIAAWNMRFGADALFYFFRYFYAGIGADIADTLAGNYGTASRNYDLTPPMLGMDVYLTGTAGYEMEMIRGRLYIPLEFKIAYCLTVPNARVLEFGLNVSFVYRFGAEQQADGNAGYREIHRN